MIFFSWSNTASLQIFQTTTEDWEKVTPVCLDIWHVVSSSATATSVCVHFSLPLPCLRSVLHVFAACSVVYRLILLLSLQRFHLLPENSFVLTSIN